MWCASGVMSWDPALEKDVLMDGGSGESGVESQSAAWTRVVHEGLQLVGCAHLWQAQSRVVFMRGRRRGGSPKVTFQGTSRRRRGRHLPRTGMIRGVQLRGHPGTCKHRSLVRRGAPCRPVPSRDRLSSSRLAEA